MCVWHAYGILSSLRWMCACGEGIVEQLKVASGKCSRRYCPNLGMFSSVAANSKLLGHSVRLGNALVLVHGIAGGLYVKGDLKMQLLWLMVGCPMAKGTVVWKYAMLKQLFLIK